MAQRLYLQPDGVRLTAAQKLAQRNMLQQVGYKMIALRPSPSGHATLMVQVNDFAPVRFLFDSGVTQTTMALDYAKTLGLPISTDAITGRGSGGGEMKIFKTQVKKIIIGPVDWFPRDMNTMDFQYVKIGEPLFGVIGIDWMQDNQAVINVGDNLVFADPISTG